MTQLRTTAPRIAPGRGRDVSVIAWVLAHAGGRQAHTEPINLFLTLGRNRRLFTGWLRFAARLMPRGRLPRRDTELVILRVAHLTGCDYERIHHERIGTRVGLTAADLRRVADGPAADGWSDRDRAVLSAVDDVHAHRDIRDETWAALRPYLDDAGYLELTLLITHYEMLATAITVLRIQPEQPR